MNADEGNGLSRRSFVKRAVATGGAGVDGVESGDSLEVTVDAPRNGYATRGTRRRSSTCRR